MFSARQSDTPNLSPEDSSERFKLLAPSPKMEVLDVQQLVIAPIVYREALSRLDDRHLAVTTIYMLSPGHIALICTHLRLLCASKSLARLARTCRLFHDTALDALWHTIPSLVPLLYTFPSELCSIKFCVHSTRISLSWSEVVSRRRTAATSEPQLTVHVNITGIYSRARSSRFCSFSSVRRTSDRD